jgi:glycosyltransferase involved in cell wall biosynthesis
VKILIYGEYFLPVVGGVQTSMNLLAKGLVDLNLSQEKRDSSEHVEVTVVTKSAAGAMNDSVLPYHVVRQPGFWRLIKLIRGADVVHVAGPCLLPMTVAWLIGKPFFVEHHGYQASCPNGLLFREPSRTLCPGYFERREYAKCVRCTSQTLGFAGGVRLTLLTFPRRWLCKRVTANIMITNHVGTRLKLPRSQTVYYGIEETARATSERMPPREDFLHFAYVGRLVAEKGLPVLLQAAKKLRDQGVVFNLSFIGDGPERSNLNELADASGLSNVVKFTGDLRGRELEQAVVGIDVVVMPSVWEETAGLSAIEQMMRGRVVIAADIGGLGEVVGDAGLKFTPGDVRALASCIRELIDDPALARSLGSAARARAVTFFRQERMIQDHVSLYREVLRQHA